MDQSDCPTPPFVATSTLPPPSWFIPAPPPKGEIFLLQWPKSLGTWGVRRDRLERLEHPEENILWGIKRPAARIPGLLLF